MNTTVAANKLHKPVKLQLSLPTFTTRGPLTDVANDLKPRLLRLALQHTLKLR